MKFLLDTHTLLWTVFEPDKLSAEAQEIIVDQNNIIGVSLVSLWEISIKRPKLVSTMSKSLQPNVHVRLPKVRLIETLVEQVTMDSLGLKRSPQKPYR